MIGSESCEEVLYQRRIFQIRRQMGPTLIKLRIDVDYPYPSRTEVHLHGSRDRSRQNSLWWLKR